MFAIWRVNVHVSTIFSLFLHFFLLFIPIVGLKKINFSNTRLMICRANERALLKCEFENCPSSPANQKGKKGKVGWKKPLWFITNSRNREKRRYRSKSLTTCGCSSIRSKRSKVFSKNVTNLFGNIDKYYNILAERKAKKGSNRGKREWATNTKKGTRVSKRKKYQRGAAEKKLHR